MAEASSTYPKRILCHNPPWRLNRNLPTTSTTDSLLPQWTTTSPTTTSNLDIYDKMPLIATVPVIVLLPFLVSAIAAESYLCNVCQNSEYGDRYLYDRSESFINPSTNQQWTCGDLQDAVQDVNPTNSGASGEAYLCTGKFDGVCFVCSICETTHN